MTIALTAFQTPKLSSQDVQDVILVLTRDRSLPQTYENTPVFIAFQYIIRMPSWTALNEFPILKTRKNEPNWLQEDALGHPRSLQDSPNTSQMVQTIPKESKESSIVSLGSSKTTPKTLKVRSRALQTRKNSH